jgi:predicted Fe-S protein YdhL (DUF1289 family)
MDAANRYCLGCKRTLDEIGRWSEMSEAEHARVLAELPQREATEPSDRPGR